jgi:putative integral membrane protein (TIGR02587 family)
MSPALALDRRREAGYARDLGRAFGGALLFGLPLLMTMEMWWFGFALDRQRLLVFLLAALPLLFGLSHYVGFRRDRGLIPDLLDTFAALAVGVVTASVLLGLIGVLEAGAPVRQWVGQITLQAVPGAMGALLARHQFGRGGDDVAGRRGEPRYVGELFLMVAGALYLMLSMAPTEEMILIAYRITPWHALALIAASLILMHVIVYVAGFAGQHEQGHPITAFFHFTLAGYGLVLLTALYILWIFGRTEGHTLKEMTEAVIIVSFPGALGAGAARLLV